MLVAANWQLRKDRGTIEPKKLNLSKKRYGISFSKKNQQMTFQKKNLRLNTLL
jgi:hypothetical protein